VRCALLWGSGTTPGVQQGLSKEDVVGSGVDLKYLLRAVLRRKWLVLAVFTVVVGVAAVHTLRQPKVFEARASMIIDVTAPRFLDRDVQDVSDNSHSNYWANREYYETQHKVITSRAVSQRVVEKLGLHTDVAFLGLDRVRDPKAREAALKGADAVAVLQGKIQVKPVKDSRVIHLVVEDLDAKRAALLANELAEAYIQENLSLKLKITESASVWLDERRSELEDRSKTSEVALFNFRKSADMLTKLEDAQNMVSQRLGALNSGLTETKLKIAAVKARVEAIRAVQQGAKAGGSRWAEGLPAANESAVVQQFKQRYATQKVECAELAERYLPEHPKLLACKEKLRLYEEDLLGELNNIVVAAEAELREATARERNLEALLATSKAEAFEVNKKQIEFEQLKREAENDQRLYDLVLKRLKDIELSGLLRTSNVRVLDAARPIHGPIRPRVMNAMLFAVLFGLLGGLGLALALEMLDSSVSSQADIEERIGLPFLGFIPTVTKEDGQKSGSVDLFIHRSPKSTVAECCRAVRTNLLFMSPDRPFKTLLVTSSGPQEGKSTTAINLGIAMSQSGNRVVILDTDMRRPRLHKAFGVPNDVGVSSVVVGEVPLDQAVKSTEVPNLFLLPCGAIPPNPAELLHTQAFKDLVAKLGEKFDRIILDSPPIGAVADAVVLSANVDGVVMVLKGGATHREVARRAVRALKDVQANVYGAVLNDINLNDAKYGYEYYAYKRYGYYYGEQKEEAS
jgi:succinoglycan biosynthesis transport protein ExoP